MSGFPSRPRRANALLLPAAERAPHRASLETPLAPGRPRARAGGLGRGGQYRGASDVTNGLFNAQNPFDRNSQRKVVRDSSGACFVVFTQTTTDREVRLARSADCTTSWQQFLLFGSSTVGQEFLFPSIDISDDRKTLHVVALATSPLGVLHTQNASLSGSGWSTADNWKRRAASTPRPAQWTTTRSSPPSRRHRASPSTRPDARTSRTSTWTGRVDRTSSTRYYNGGWTAGPERQPDHDRAAATLPQELDPSVDHANGYLHVLFKDDSFPLDGSARTDRYRYVRNVNATDFTSFTAPATLIEQGTLLARPGSLAAYGRRIWVVGGYSSGAGYGWRNSSADDGATWADGATGATFEASLLTYSPVVGLNPAGSDHRVVAMRADGSQEVYRYRWNGTTWGSRTNTVTESGSNGADLLHVSIEKHKPAGVNNIVYCWYKSGASYDNIYCSLETQAMTQSPRTYLRSIGTAANYTTGNVTIASVGDTTVNGSRNRLEDGQPRSRRSPHRRPGQLRHPARGLQHAAHPDLARGCDRDDLRLHDRASVHDAAGLGGLHLLHDRVPVLPGGQRQPRGRRPERGRHRLQGHRVQALERRAGRRAPLGGRADPLHRRPRGQHRRDPHDHPDRGRVEPSLRAARNGGRARQRSGRRLRRPSSSSTIT